MSTLLAVALSLSPIEIGVILFTGIGFLVLFGYSSASGGYQDLIKTTLDNDEMIRKNKK